jgi:hypothetical protein
VHREYLIETAERYIAEDAAMPTDLITSLINEGIDVAALEASLNNLSTETDELG